LPLIFFVAGGVSGCSNRNSDATARNGKQEQKVEQQSIDSHVQPTVTEKIVESTSSPHDMNVPDSVPAETLSRKMVIPDFEPVQAILVCSMIGENLDSQLLVNIVKTLHQKVRVIILINSPDQISLCRTILLRAGIPPGSVDLLRCTANSIWIRDYAPIFVRQANGDIVAVESTYTRSADPGMARPNDEFAIALSNLLDLDIDGLPILLDGGNVVSNGHLVYTTTSVLSANRSRGFDGKRLVRLFRRHFGEMKWLMTPPLKGEPTGHADTFVTFLCENTVVIGRMDPDDEPKNAALLDDLAIALGKQRVGEEFVKVFRVPLTRNGEVWRAYCNVVVVNNTILVPSFADTTANEAEVLSVYRQAAPNADVVAIPCDSLLGYDGLLHCMTLTIPRGIDIELLNKVLTSCP
jgi:agmatine/peptidylarginine deiminase